MSWRARESSTLLGTIEAGQKLTGEDYEIRLLGAGGTTALLFVTRCLSDAHAREVAMQMLKESLTGFEIWRGQLCVENFSRARNGR